LKLRFIVPSPDHYLPSSAAFSLGVSVGREHDHSKVCGLGDQGMRDAAGKNGTRPCIRSAPQGKKTMLGSCRGPHEGWKRPMSRHDGRKLCVDVVPILEALSRTRFDDRPPEGGKA
jgi:hypothetical protein